MCNASFINHATSPARCDAPTRRDKERLEKYAEDALEAGKEEVRQRTVAVGQYELSLDILADDLQDAKEKLAKVRARNTTHSSCPKKTLKYLPLPPRTQHIKAGLQKNIPPSLLAVTTSPLTFWRTTYRMLRKNWPRCVCKTQHSKVALKTLKYPAPPRRTQHTKVRLETLTYTPVAVGGRFEFNPRYFGGSPAGRQGITSQGCMRQNTTETC